MEWQEQQDFLSQRVTSAAQGRLLDPTPRPVTAQCPCYHLPAAQQALRSLTTPWESTVFPQPQFKPWNRWKKSQVYCGRLQNAVKRYVTEQSEKSHPHTVPRESPRMPDLQPWLRVCSLHTFLPVLRSRKFLRWHIDVYAAFASVQERIFGLSLLCDAVH